MIATTTDSRKGHVIVVDNPTGNAMNRQAAFLRDPEIRPALRARLLATHARDGDTAILEEGSE